VKEKIRGKEERISFMRGFNDNEDEIKSI